MLPNSGGVDPSGRGLNPFAPNQAQAANNVYGIGGNMPGIHSVQGGLQAGLGRPGYLPVSSAQGDRYAGGTMGPGGMHQVGGHPSHERYMLGQYGQNQRGLAGHPGLAIGGFSNTPQGTRNQFSQLGLPNQNPGNRPVLDRPSLVNTNMNFANFGGNVGQTPQGLSSLYGGQQAGGGLNLGGMRTIGNVRALNAMGGGISRDMAGIQRVPGQGPGIGGLLHSGVGQQSNAPIPSQDLLAIMSRSNVSRPGVPSGLFGIGSQLQQGQGAQQQQMNAMQQQGAQVLGGGGVGGGPNAGLFSQQRVATIGGGNLDVQRPIGAMGGPGGMDGQVTKPAFDVNDFPSLGGSVTKATGPIGVQQGPVGVVVSGPGDGQVIRDGEVKGLEGGEQLGLTMQKEDFPALPTSQSGQESVIQPRVVSQPQSAIGKGVGVTARSQPMAIMSEQSMSQAPPTGPNAGQTYFQPSHNMPSSVHDSLKTIQQGQIQRVGGQGRGGLVAGGKLPSAQQNATAQMSAASQANCDRFSLLGLLSVIRMIDEDLAMLALGQDLTTLGLQLDRAGFDLHKTFLSPWSNNQLPGDAQEFTVPNCYRLPPEKLRPEYLSKFKDETLFYIFYSCPNEEGQLLAAYQLSTRGLVWHKDLKMWMMRLPNQGLQKSPDGWERGSYVFFDTNEWKYQRRDNFLLRYEAIENNPTLPRTGQTAGNQPVRQPPPPQGPPVGAPGTSPIMVQAK